MVLDFKVNARLVVGMTINFFLSISEGEDSFFFRALQRSSTSALFYFSAAENQLRADGR